MNTTDKLLKQMENAKEKASMTDEEMKTLKQCCLAVFSSREGKIVANAMMKVSGIYKLDTDLDPLRGAFRKGTIYVYLFFIKGMLDKETISEIETREKRQ